MDTERPPLPPFTMEGALQKVRLAEDGWNSRDPELWPGSRGAGRLSKAAWREKAALAQSFGADSA